MASSTRASSTNSIPELVDGDRMTADEFERRYHASPHIRKAELIEGVVHVASPVSDGHSSPHSDLDQWVGFYRIGTPFVRSGVDGTVRLDDENQPQPDVHLRIEPGRGGRSRTSDDGYIEGGPELVAEVAVSSK